MERREQRSQEGQRLRVRRRIRMAGLGALGLVVVGVLAVGIWFVSFQPRPGESVSASGGGPAACPDLIRQLRSVTERYDSKVILAPYTNMDSQIALTSWGKIDLLDEFDRERIEEFVDKNRNHAPENVP